ncbi:MAG: DUF4238 domain-containing protein [Candidatus Paceibacterota bacterium]
MAKHHTVQDKYLKQWHIPGTQNHLNVFIIPEGKCHIANTKSPLFWRKDFNVLEDEKEKSYLPEEITSVIDTKGIEAIRKIDFTKQEQLSGIDRSCIAFYVALQYTRTPQHREEANKMIGATIKYFMRKDLYSPDKVKMSKKDILEHEPNNKYEKEALEKIRVMSQEEINTQLFEAIHGDSVKVGLTRTGHSKGILKVPRHANKIFEMQWLFLIAPKDTSFATSDSPCFTVSRSKIMNGLLSPHSTVSFPLRPDVCICIKPGMKSQTEHFMNLDKKQVRDINSLILTHSYECFVAKDKPQLDKLIKGFDYKNHRKSRDVTISEFGDYTLFNAE